MVSMQRFTSFLTDIPQKWRDFVENNAQTFDQTSVWFEAFERHLLSPGQRLTLSAMADAGGEPLALLPLKMDRVDLLKGISASGVTALSNYYTALYGPVVRQEEESRAAPLLAKALMDVACRTSVIDLNPLAAESPLASAVLSECRRLGHLTERYFRFGNWYLDVAGRSSTEYFQSLPGQLRSTISRKGKKLRTLTAAKIRIVSDPAEVPSAMDAYEVVYRRSWKTDEPHKDFIRAVATAFAERGRLRLGLVEIRDQPVAAQLWFVHRGTASIFKLAYDEEYREHSAGSVLTSVLMEHVIDVDKVEMVDYLCGDDSYKRDWMSGRRERIGIRAVRPYSWPGALVAATTTYRRLKGTGPVTRGCGRG